MKNKKCWYQKSIPFGKYLHYVPRFGRSEINFLTNDLEVVSQKINKGWLFYKCYKGFCLKAPEQWLVDISEPTKITYFTSDPIHNYAYFLYIKDKPTEELLKIIKKRSNIKEEIFMSQGPALETEFRLILDDKSDGKRIAFDMYTYFLQDKNYKKYIDKSHDLIQKTRFIDIEKNRKIDDYPEKIHDFFLEIKRKYEAINLENKPLYNRDYVCSLSTQVKNTIKKIDHFIFVPWGCFKYIGSFLTEENINKIILWEMHISKYKKHQHQFGSHDLKGKKVVILDKSYTGRTLNKIADKVKLYGGNPIKVALFPKSKMAVENSDYVIFVDRIFHSQKINTSNKEWYTQLYKKILAD